VTRPETLPEFEKPPLNEVVVGIQFTPARGYQQIRAGEVWALFRDRFPQVEELPPLAPMFETFGLPQAQHVNFGIVSGATHDRFWFLSETRDELIQFQNDRLLHNWRKVGTKSEYPRFERIFNHFESEVRSLEAYFSNLYPQLLNINQCEISYINHIRPVEADRIDLHDWLSFFTFPNRQVPDDFSASFRKVILNPDGRPSGRLYCEAASAAEPNGRQLISLTLTARGAPSGSDVNAALEFLARGREMIVGLFADVTTESAHKIWERVR
jgi:uncharacterized protein (TIGR04255 family)